jgi:hypothetical protein
MAPNDSNRIAVLESQFADIARYMQEGRVYMREDSERREKTASMLAVVINQQASYQAICELDRKDIDTRVTTVEKLLSNQAGKTSIISVIVGTITAGAIALAAAIIGRH